MPARCFILVVLARALAPIARSFLHALRQSDLVAEVVVDDPFAPGVLKPIPVHAHALEQAAALLVSGRRGIESDPAVAGKKYFHPHVRVAGADDPVAADVVVLAGKKSADVARGNAQIAQHHGHGGGKIFAVAGAASEKKIGERIGGTRAGEVQRVAVMRFQIQLDFRGFVVLVGRTCGDLFGELLDARIEPRNLQIRAGDRNPENPAKPGATAARE